MQNGNYDEMAKRREWVDAFQGLNNPEMRELMINRIQSMRWHPMFDIIDKDIIIEQLNKIENYDEYDSLMQSLPLILAYSIRNLGDKKLEASTFERKFREEPAAQIDESDLAISNDIIMGTVDNVLRETNPDDKQKMFLRSKDDAIDFFHAINLSFRLLDPEWGGIGKVIQQIGAYRQEIEVDLRPENKDMRFGVTRNSSQDTVTYAYLGDPRVNRFYPYLLKLFNHLGDSNSVTKKNHRIYDPASVIQGLIEIIDKDDIPVIFYGGHELTNFQKCTFKENDDFLILNHTEITHEKIDYLFKKLTNCLIECFIKRSDSKMVIALVGEAIWYFMQLLPYKRGSAFGAEIIMEALFRKYEIRAKYMSSIPLDWLALFSPSPQFFSQLFQRVCLNKREIRLTNGRAIEELSRIKNNHLRKLCQEAILRRSDIVFNLGDMDDFINKINTYFKTGLNRDLFKNIINDSSLTIKHVFTVVEEKLPDDAIFSFDNIEDHTDNVADLNADLLSLFIKMGYDPFAGEQSISNYKAISEIKIDRIVSFLKEHPEHAHAFLCRRNNDSFYFKMRRRNFSEEYSKNKAISNEDKLYVDMLNVEYAKNVEYSQKYSDETLKEMPSKCSMTMLSAISTCGILDTKFLVTEQKNIVRRHFYNTIERELEHIFSLPHIQHIDSTLRSKLQDSAFITALTLNPAVIAIFKDKPAFKFLTDQVSHELLEIQRSGNELLYR